MLKPASCFDRINRIKQDDLLLFILFILCILSKELLDLRPDYFGIVSNPPDHHQNAIVFIRKGLTAYSLNRYSLGVPLGRQ